MPTIITVSGLVITIYGFRLLRLPKSDRSNLSLITAIIICTTGIFIFVSGTALLLLSHS